MRFSPQISRHHWDHSGTPNRSFVFPMRRYLVCTNTCLHMACMRSEFIRKEIINSLIVIDIALMYDDLNRTC